MSDKPQFEVIPDRHGRWFVFTPEGGEVGPYSTEQEGWDWVNAIKPVPTLSRSTGES